MKILFVLPDILIISNFVENVKRILSRQLTLCKGNNIQLYKHDIKSNIADTTELLMEQYLLAGKTDKLIFISPTLSDNTVKLCQNTAEVVAAPNNAPMLYNKAALFFAYENSYWFTPPPNVTSITYKHTLELAKKIDELARLKNDPAIINYHAPTFSTQDRMCAKNPD